MIFFAAWVLLAFPLALAYGALQILFPTHECRNCGFRGWGAKCPCCGSWGGWWIRLK